MRKVASSASFIVMCCIMLVPIFVFAQAQSDSIGKIGKDIIDYLDGVGVENSVQIYSVLAGLLGWASTRLITLVLKKTKTTWYWNSSTKTYAVGTVWKILATLFGKSVLYYKSNFENTNSVVARKKMTEEIGKHINNHGNDVSVDIK